MSEKTTIELDQGDAALVLSENGEISLYMPQELKEDEDAYLPNNVYFLAGVAALLSKDEELFSYVSERASQLIKDIEQKE